MPTLRLDITDFTGGLAPSQYKGGTNQADPVNTAGWDCLSYQEENILQRGFGNATLTDASFVGGEMYAMRGTNRNSESSVFGIAADSAGTGAVLHKINTLTDAVYKTSPWPHPLPAIATFGGIGAELYDGYFYYAYGKYLGRYDMSVTFNDSWNSSLTTAAYGALIDHPMVQGNGKLFIGNAQTVGGACVTQVAGDTVTLVALDLKKTDKVIKSLEFQGNYLFIALSGNMGGSVYSAECSLVAWDTVSGSWQNEWSFPENDFTAVKSVNGRLFAWGTRGFYEFTGNRFVPIHPVAGSPKHYGTDVSPRGILHFSDTSGNIWSYGSPQKDQPDIVQKPVNGLGSGAGRSIRFTSNSKMLVSKTTSDGVRMLMNGATAFPAAGAWRSPVFNPGQRIRVVSVKLVGQPLASGTSFTVTLYDETGKNRGCGTFNTAGESEFSYVPNGFDCDTFQLGIAHSDGASPKIRRITVEYAPAKD